MSKKIILFFLVSFAATPAFSQEFYRKDINYVDTATSMIWASPNFSVQFPFGKGYLSSTFDFNYNVGFDFTIKTNTNWTIDVGFNYMFGSKLRATKNNLIDSWRNIVGDMVFGVDVIRKDSIATVPAFWNGAGNNGLNLACEGRYWNFGITVGKIIPLDRWKNSGLWLKMGIGYFGHKIYFVDPNSFFPQIDQATYYRYGYDQRSSGVALNQFIGYLFMHKRRVLSFYVGVEFWEIFTKPDRGYIFVGDFAGNTDLLPRKFSGLFGVKAGWILPFYEKKRVTTFYTF
jgi:hypothetical protein